MPSLAARAPSLAPPALLPPQPRMLYRARLDLTPALLASRRHVVELIAPAGYGKSTLLGAWQQQAAAAGRRSLLVTLDGRTRSPLALLRRILGAWYDAPEGSVALDSEAAGLDLLLAETGTGESGCVLLLDDVQWLADTPALQTLQWLLDNQPEALIIVLAGREPLALPLQARRLRGQLTRLGTADLAFTAAECASFLRERHHIALDREGLARLHRHTEGWAAALQLAALSLAGTEDRAGFIRGFDGAHRDIADYLAETVLARLSPAQRDFLFRVSVLDRLCAGLCAEVTGMANAQQLLEELERRNLFLLAVDPRRQWFRFHALFRDFLRARAQARDPERLRRDAETAARWCLERGYREDAIEYALQAGLCEYAAQLISGYVLELVKLRGEHARLVEWIGRLPAGVLARHPGIRINHAWSLTFQYRFGEAEATLDALAGTGDAPPDPALADEIRCARELNRCLAAGLADHAEAVLQLSDRWLADWPAAPPPALGPLLTIRAYAYKCTGDFAAAEQAVAGARRCFAAAGTPYGMGWIDFFGVLVLMRQGRYAAARAACGTALSLSAERLGTHSVIYCMQSALMGALEYEANQLGAARKALAQGLKFLEPQGSVDSVLVAYLTLARLTAAEGRYADACELLQEGEASGRRRGAQRLCLTLAAARVAVLLRWGRADAAQALLAELAAQAGGDGEYAGVLRDKLPRLQARLQLLRGDAAGALELLAAPIRAARQRQRAGKLVEMLLTRACALHTLGREQEALRALDEALELAAREQLVRSVLDHGEALQPLLAALQAKRGDGAGSPAQELLRQLLAAIRDARAPADEADGAGLREALTRRELQILRMTESGLSNRQLASALFVSEGTLKWHLYNIYGKLGVRNRSGAIAKARRLRLL